MATKKAPKQSPDKVGDVLRKVPVSKLPVRVGDSYELTPKQMQWFDDQLREISRTPGIEQFFGVLGDQEVAILRQGFGASIGYWHLEELRRFIDKVLPVDDWNGQEMRWYLDKAEAGFKLAMQMAESALEERQRVLLAALTQGQRAANKRWENDPAGKAMREVRKEWEAWEAGSARYKNDAAFARAMTMKYEDITNEGSIKNAISRWRDGK